MASNPVTHHEGLEVSTVVERKGGYRNSSQACVLASYLMKEVRYTLSNLTSGHFVLKLTSDVTPGAPSEFVLSFEREQLEQLRDTIDCIFQLEHDDASLIHGTPERRLLDLRALGITGSTVAKCGLCEGDGRFDDVECHRCKGTGRAQ